MVGALSYPMFKLFVCCKAFDIIGSGGYKVFLVRCRDNHDEWAVEAYQHVCAVSEHVKAVGALVAQLRRFSAAGLTGICRDIVCNTTPPVHGAPTWNVCQISGQHSARCVELLRTQHRAVAPVFVHEKYVSFLQLLWFVSKIEHVVRNVTRSWLRAANADGAGDTAELCERFAAQDARFEDLFSAFDYGSRYVRTSLERYCAHMEQTMPLDV